MKEELGKQISVVSIVRDLLREWLVILLLAVSVSLFTNIAVKTYYQPIYKAKTTFAVTAKGANNNVYKNLTSAKDLATRFTQILDSNVLQKKVMEELELREFAAETVATQISETNMVELEVSAGSAMDAYRILNSILENYDSVSDYVIGNVILEIVQPPSIPAQPSNSPNVKRAMIRSFLIAVIVVSLFLAWLSYKRDTIKSESQLSEKVDAKRLGTVYRERKSQHPLKRKGTEKVSMLIENPLRSFWFVEANHLTASRIRSQMEHKDRKVLMVTSVMENEGKSTLASNLALSLAQEVNRVLLIDCDFRKPSLHKIFELPDEMLVDFPKALENGTDAGSLMKQYGESNLYLIASNAKSTSVEAGLLKDLIEACKEQMDYIILDTAPMALVSDTEEMARLADASLLVVREDMVLAKHINDAVDTLNRTEGKVLGCVFNYATRGIGTASSGYRYGGYYGKGAQ